jgi:hypothetical protein
MRLPIAGNRFSPVFIVASALFSLVAVFINAKLLPGWMFAGSAVLLVLTIIYALYSRHWSGMTVRFGILTYAVASGIWVVARTHPSFMGDFTYGNAPGPFMGTVGLLVGLPWFLTVLFSIPLANRMSSNLYLRSLIGAALFLVPSLFFFYNCASLDFIYWTEVFPPMRAFILCFVAGFFFHFAASQMQVASENTMAVPLYVVWLGFNILLLCARMLLKN